MSLTENNDRNIQEALVNFMNEEDEREADTEDEEDSDQDDDSHVPDHAAEVLNNEEAIENARFEKVKSSYIHDRTRYGYHRAMAQFVIWIFNRMDQNSNILNENLNILHPDLVAALHLENAKTKPCLSVPAMEHISKASKTYLPIDLPALTVPIFMKFLISRTADGQYLSKSTYGGYRSGLFDLFRSCGLNQNFSFREELELCFAGLRRSLAEEKGRTGGKLGEGKRPMPFILYRKLCTWMIADGSKEALFSWAFLTLTWNLVCRSKNTTCIHKNHLSWEDDSLIIQFAHQKTDMEGDTDATKRHIYANPEDPCICPILALSVYLATTARRESGLLFGGNNQYERFRKFLQV